MAIFIQVGVAIKLARLEVLRESSGGCSRQRHFTICMPHGPAFMFSHLLFAECMPCICRRDDLHIRKTQRPVIVGTAIETASLLFICGKYFL